MAQRTNGTNYANNERHPLRIMRNNGTAKTNRTIRVCSRTHRSNRQPSKQNAMLHHDGNRTTNRRRSTGTSLATTQPIKLRSIISRQPIRSSLHPVRQRRSKLCTTKVQEKTWTQNRRSYERNYAVKKTIGKQKRRRGTKRIYFRGGRNI